MQILQQVRLRVVAHSAIRETTPRRFPVRTRHYSRRTEEAYVHWIHRYIVFHGKRHPSHMGVAEISRFLTFLAVEQRVSASTQNQALSALLFLYRHVLAMPIGDIRRHGIACTSQ